jgi:hypothetical protein
VQDEVNKLLNEIIAIRRMNPGHERNVRQIALDRKCNMLHEQHKTKGLRIDVQITETFTGEERWVDATCIHPTCQTRIEDEFRNTKKIIAAYEEARTKNTNNTKFVKIGYAVKDQTGHKHTVYSPLITVANKQVVDGRRRRAPVFLAAATSTLGELGRETVLLQEFLTAAYGRKLAREGPRQDGVPHKRLTAMFRNKFRLKIIMAIAKGLAFQIWSAGLPRSSCRKYNNN